MALACVAHVTEEPAGAQAPYPVKDRYTAAGPHAVTTHAETSAYTVVRPAVLSDTGRHPILTFANGTGAACAGAGPALEHLASWGYVVICANSGSTGSGDQVLAAARYMVAKDTEQGSIYQGRLDVSSVGAFGHSQGACGAVNATLKSQGLITSTLPGAYIDPFWAFWVCPSPGPDWGRLTAPTLFLWGSADFLTTGGQVQRTYDAVTAAPTARASLVGGCHCIEDAYLPYMVAWFDYTLGGDALARSAFVSTSGAAPELARNPEFQSTAFKGMP